VIVYELQAAPGFAVLLHADEHDLDRLIDAFDGSPMASGWSPMRFFWETDHGARPIPDFTEIGQAPVFNQRALEALSDLLTGRAELLPIEVPDDGGLEIANVTEVRDALDEDASELKRFYDGRVMRITRYVFDAAKLDEATIFKLPQQRGRTYVTDRFADRAREAGLTGMDLIERWRDDRE
jgi:hypothetical protein